MRVSRAVSRLWFGCEQLCSVLLVPFGGNPKGAGISPSVFSVPTEIGAEFLNLETCCWLLMSWSDRKVPRVQEENACSFFFQGGREIGTAQGSL